MSKRSVVTLVVTATLVVCQHCGVYADEGASSALAPNPTQALQSLSWLEGRWRGTTSDGETFEALYSSPEGGVILSVNKCFAGERLLFTEFERFEAREGKVVMTPFPDGQRACTFDLVEHDPTARRVAFANPANDFPERIVYERPSDAALRIVVSGQQGGRPVTLVLDLRRS